jgi:membrane-associated phospholipid phosphatase
MTILYGELPALMAGAAGGSAAVVYHDSLIQRWETGLFGASPAITLAGQLPSSLSPLLHGAYLSYYALIFVPPLVLFARRDRGREFQTTILALTAAFAACFVVFVYFPVQGPRYAWPAPPGMPQGTVRDFTLRVLKSGSSRGAAFPSSHVAVAITQAILALRYQRRRVGLVTTAAALLLALGAVYAGFHYASDVLAGATLGILLTAVVLAYAKRARSLLSISDIQPRLQGSPGE